MVMVWVDLFVLVFFNIFNSSILKFKDCLFISFTDFSVSPLFDDSSDDTNNNNASYNDQY